MRILTLFIGAFLLFTDVFGQSQSPLIPLARLDLAENKIHEDSVDVEVAFKVLDGSIPDSIRRFQVRIGWERGTGEIFSRDYFTRSQLENKLTSLDSVYGHSQGLFTFSGTTGRDAIRPVAYMIIYGMYANGQRSVLYEEEIQTALKE